MKQHLQFSIGSFYLFEPPEQIQNGSLQSVEHRSISSYDSLFSHQHSHSMQFNVIAWKGKCASYSTAGVVGQV